MPCWRIFHACARCGLRFTSRTPRSLRRSTISVLRWCGAVMVEALLALGGNVGNSRAILDRAIDLLCDGKDVRLTARSSDYRTPPWGFKYQPYFVNLAIAVETTLNPRELLARAQEIELQLGRDRAHEKRNGPRTADIDIIAYDDLVLHEPNLTLPHPRLFERGFVLIPLAEIAGDRVIAGRRVDEAASVVDGGTIQRL